MRAQGNFDLERSRVDRAAKSIKRKLKSPRNSVLRKRLDDQVKRLNFDGSRVQAKRKRVPAKNTVNTDRLANDQVQVMRAEFEKTSESSSS